MERKALELHPKLNTKLFQKIKYKYTLTLEHKTLVCLSFPKDISLNLDLKN